VLPALRSSCGARGPLAASRSFEFESVTRGDREISHLERSMIATALADDFTRRDRESSAELAQSVSEPIASEDGRLHRPCTASLRSGSAR